VTKSLAVLPSITDLTQFGNVVPFPYTKPWTVSYSPSAEARKAGVPHVKAMNDFGTTTTSSYATVQPYLTAMFTSPPAAPTNYNLGQISMTWVLRASERFSA